MRLRLIVPLVAALALAACESTPEEDGSAVGEGVEAALEPAPAQDDVETTVVMEPEEPLAEPPDPALPEPGSHQDLVQRVGDRVFFALDSAVLDADARRTLERQAEWLRLFPENSLIIEGHCDERGTREYNLALGERRANAVREYLITQGIAPSRLTTISYGKERPYALDHNEEAWALNRRAVSVKELN